MVFDLLMSRDLIIVTAIVTVPLTIVIWLYGLKTDKTYKGAFDSLLSFAILNLFIGAAFWLLSFAAFALVAFIQFLESLVFSEGAPVRSGRAGITIFIALLVIIRVIFSFLSSSEEEDEDSDESSMETKE